MCCFQVHTDSLLGRLKPLFEASSSLDRAPILGAGNGDSLASVYAGIYRVCSRTEQRETQGYRRSQSSRPLVTGLCDRVPNLEERYQHAGNGGPKPYENEESRNGCNLRGKVASKAVTFVESCEPLVSDVGGKRKS